MQEKSAILRVFSISFLCLLFASCKTTDVPRLAPRETQLVSASVKVPVRLFSGLPLVQAKVNDEGPYWFLVDTGSGIVVVSDRITRQLSLVKYKTKGQIIGPAGKEKGVENLYRLESISLGENRNNDIDCIGLDFSDIRDVLGIDLDGVLGFSFFRNILFQLDFSNSQMLLMENDLPKDPEGEVLPYDLIGGVPFISALVGDLKVDLIVDTGSNGTISIPKAIQDRLLFKHGPARGRSVLTIGGVSREIVARLNGTISIGPHQASNPIVNLSEGSKGAVGASILKHFTMTFDQTRQTVCFLRTSGTGPIESEPVRSAGIVMMKRNGIWIVEDITPNTPASQLDVTIGDRLVSVNTLSGNKLNLGIWHKLIAGEDVLRLKLMRENHELEVEVPVTVFVP
jgi:predicted aspartyl protease